MQWDCWHSSGVVKAHCAISCCVPSRGCGGRTGRHAAVGGLGALSGPVHGRSSTLIQSLAYGTLVLCLYSGTRLSAVSPMERMTQPPLQFLCVDAWMGLG